MYSGVQKEEEELYVISILEQDLVENDACPDR